MDTVWALSAPEPAENAYPDPICTDYLPAQDETNDYANIYRQTYERAIPRVFIDITPQIYGGGGVEQTAYATNLKRNQAMLQLSMYADAGRSYWCDATFNAV